MNEPHVLDPPEILRGHVDECLRHLAAEFTSKVEKGSRNADKAKEPMAKFCKVSTSTVQRWFSGKVGLPTGENLIRLMCYLDMMGYKVIEFENMTKVLRHYSELIAFGLISGFQEAAELVGYINVGNFSQVIQERVGSTEDKKQKMFEVWKAKKEELKLAKETAKKEFCLDFQQEIATPCNGKIIEDVSLTDLQKTVKQSLQKEAVMGIIKNSMALLREIPLEEFSESEHATLQQFFAAEIFRLSQQPRKGKTDG